MTLIVNIGGVKIPLVKRRGKWVVKWDILYPTVKEMENRIRFGELAKKYGGKIPKGTVLSMHQEKKESLSEQDIEAIQRGVRLLMARLLAKRLNSKKR